MYGKLLPDPVSTASATPARALSPAPAIPPFRRSTSSTSTCVHLTSAGFAILGEYIVNRLQAPSTLPVQAAVGASTEQAFAQTLFSRMDMVGGGTTGGFAPQRELADFSTHPMLGPPQDHRLSVYLVADGDVSDGERTTTGAGFKLTSVGGTAGAEYRLTDYALVGGAFNYENSIFKIATGNGKTNGASYQFGLYGTVATTNYFAQGLVAGGVQDYRNTRPGVVDPISSSPHGSTFVAGGKVGRLFDTSGMRVGPIAGLLYGRARSTTSTRMETRSSRSMSASRSKTRLWRAVAPRSVSHSRTGPRASSPT